MDDRLIPIETVSDVDGTEKIEFLWIVSDEENDPNFSMTVRLMLRDNHIPSYALTSDEKGKLCTFARTPTGVAASVKLSVFEDCSVEFAKTKTDLMYIRTFPMTIKLDWDDDSVQTTLNELCRIVSLLL
jgi:hypothetical protein